MPDRTGLGGPPAMVAPSEREGSIAAGSSWRRPWVAIRTTAGSALTPDRRRPFMPSLVRVFVVDVDDTCARALKAGATVVTSLAGSAFGQRGAGHPRGGDAEAAPGSRVRGGDAGGAGDVRRGDDRAGERAQQQAGASRR
ncbi:hypothetical protein ABZ960_18780 [Streptomyces pseudovenezuelae]|uniref:hypothetical protein n=1 Tax=Streptomyces pseudovenezuelae TaxID=67350 RepID=UPI0034A360B7